MAQNFIIGGTTYNGVDSISMTNENGEKITYVEKVNSGTGVPVAQIGNRQFYTVEDALKEAVSGETVTMIADSAEPVNLIIPIGVTLNLQSNTLTCNSIIGMDGSFLTANVAATTGKLIVPTKDSALLAEGCVTNSSGYGILPIWITDHYEFSLFVIANADLSNGVAPTVTDDAISLSFRHRMSGAYMSMMQNDGGLAHGVKVIVKLTYGIGNGDLELIYVCGDASFKVISDGKHNYTYGLTNYSELGIDLSKEVYISAAVVTDCGMSAYSDRVRVQVTE